MIGDDLFSDVGGAQEIGVRGVLVKTGKWREEWQSHPRIKPDLIVENLAHFVSTILGDDKK